ncbi:pseudaminic acid cytidylyltransferase [Dyadobacter sediminis]|uniref:Pseudaminic acid cytidylyltransferase n=1 Tax=Dyadobacter sediminis TaxID=1493691 RepID=A0A5R9K989_9BACT|nr:pseudaminic acid cytidylyltransferase [Dyadobacter sediminis]TLU90642.1 pseudaminic acid cytidylyltransferase [Dyadobacter sediminis]GGC09537.1 pseudaminic acid cytidylyltransferase [Dyadobacter sediminis]
MDKALAIIPARGGSKRIPRKNIRDFLGKPIIAYAIETALNSGLFSDVMVSTDDPEIAEIGKNYGASVPFLRSKGNANDFASTVDVIKEVEKEYEARFSVIYDKICCIYATAPFIQTRHLRAGLSLLSESGFDSVFPVVPFSYPIWRGLEVTNGKVQMVWPENQNVRSQDLKPVYHDAGQWYWYNPAKITDSLFTSNTASVILSEEEVQDIDTASDWLMAEMKYKLLYEK